MAEHERLRGLLAAARAALECQEAAPATREVVTELGDALDTHLEQEESLYYPTIWALRPGLKQQLQTLIGSHPGLRSHLDALAKAVASGSFEDARHHIEQLSTSFGEHEQAEELVLLDLDREIETIDS